MKKMLFFLAPDGTGAGEGAPADNPQGGSGDGTGSDTGASLRDIMTGGAGAEPSTRTDDKGDGGKGGGAGAESHPAWMQQLTEDMRDDGELRKFGSIKELVAAYKELAGARDGAVKPPAADAKPEEIAAFYEKLGKPKTADAYGIKSADGTDVAAFKKMAFDANLTEAQAKAVFASLEAQGREMLAAHQAQAERQFAETDAALRKEFGQKYGEKMELLKRGMMNFGGAPLQKKLADAGLSFDPDVVRLFLHLGELGAEAGTVSQGAHGGAYKSVAEGGMIKFEHLDQIS